MNDDPAIAVRAGTIDDVILPRSTRRRIARAGDGDAAGKEGGDAGAEAR